MSEPSGESQPDAELARRAGLGDRRAFASIVDRHGSAMFRFARRMLNNDHDAEDVVQEALIRAWRGLPDYRGEAQVRTWLLTLTVNRARTARGRRTATPVDNALLSSQAAPAEREPLAALLSSELVAALDTALAELPWRQRAVWLLFEVEGLSYAATAATLGTTTGSVRGQLHRARRTLAARLARWR